LANQQAPRASFADMSRYHSDDYLGYVETYFDKLSRTPRLEKYSIGVSADTPAFPNMYEFCSLTSGASLLAAELLIQNRAGVVVNWMGGFHHAKREKASGFCYVNDIVLSIQRLLSTFQRVLYIDIDVHHGDGVEEAFESNPRVLTLSLHQYDEVEKFFPGTGNFDSNGTAEAKFYALNVPLKPGIDDATYKYLFDKIFDQTLAVFRPDVIWLQCGADSLVGDKLGRFFLSTKGHGAAVQKVLKAKVPTILGGGGGYTIENVARCWAYETSLALGIELPNQLPDNLYFGSYYRTDSNLHVSEASYANTRDSDKAFWRLGKDGSRYSSNYQDKSYAEYVLKIMMDKLKRLESNVAAS
jgi:histone deacetylase 1/2